MNTGLYRGAAALQASQRRLETVTSNLANLSSAGFKRNDAVHRTFRVGRFENGFRGVETSTRTDFSQGPLLRTSNPLDLALFDQENAPTSFFAVEGPQGEVYTRNGTFQFDGNGTLVTLDGYPVAWEGATRRLDPQLGIVKIDTGAYVSQNGENIGRLKVVSFAADDALEHSGTGYWRAGPALAAAPSTADVHQGALEGANVSAVDELVQLIAVQRDFEAASNLLEFIGNSYERLNNAS